MMRSRFKVGARAFSLLEVIFAFAILVAALIPLTDLMTTTNRGVKVTRDHLVASNLAEMAFEQVYQAATEDRQGSFDRAATGFSTPNGATAASGCPGVSISNLVQASGDTLMPADGDPTLDPASGDPDYVSLYKRYSYTLDIRVSTSNNVTTADGQPTMMHVEVRVYWKDLEGNCQSVGLSNYVARRQY